MLQLIMEVVVGVKYLIQNCSRKIDFNLLRVHCPHAALVLKDIFFYVFAILGYIDTMVYECNSKLVM